MVRIALALTASAALGLIGAWMVLANVYPNEGPWLPITATHGIHVGDVVIVGLWAAVTWGLLRWARAAEKPQR